MVCLFPYDELDKVGELTIERVLARGDNHQSIKSSSYGEQKVLGIMRGFMNRFQPVNVERRPDSLFDLVISLRVRDKNSSQENAKTILHELNREYPALIPEVPSSDKIEDAFNQSLNYKPKITKIVRGSGASQSKKVYPPFSPHILIIAWRL